MPKPSLEPRFGSDKNSVSPKEEGEIGCASALLSCTGCHGHSLTLRGEVVQCDDCGTIQAAIIDRLRIVEKGVAGFVRSPEHPARR